MMRIAAGSGPKMFDFALMNLARDGGCSRSDMHRQACG